MGKLKAMKGQREINIWIREGCELSGDRINPEDDGQNCFLLAGDG